MQKNENLSIMQNNLSFLPMVQKYILEKMPKGGFSLVSQRLNNAGSALSGRQVLNEIRTLKKNNNLEIIYHSLMVLKDNKYELSPHCEDFLKGAETIKAG